MQILNHFFESQNSLKNNEKHKYFKPIKQNYLPVTQNGFFVSEAKHMIILRLIKFVLVILLKEHSKNTTS
jgi:hypothetical protein